MKLIEPATPEEFEQYYALRWLLLRKPWNQPRGSEQDDQEKYAYHIMAIENRQATGVARLEFPQTHLAQLRYMAVRDSDQLKGTGRNIIRHMEKYALSRSINMLFLHARENAIGFYEKMGYQQIEKSYVLFDTIRHTKMRKILPNNIE
ncbi:hypothetical protein MNBD_GAMMA11-1159 [hydrothermal vent metagenome]|uniref:N-acetyltransferase domain-containing protein n=1 Tax=hydrothermal vent metagenome TaxID=652676 RepID=A0A3B0X585_9ZZZZ